MELQKSSSSVPPEYEDLLASDDNYLAYALAFILDWLLQREPSVGFQILHQLYAYNNTGEDIRISTRALSQRIPDIRVFSQGKLLMYIEVTSDSELGCHQLARYKETLNSYCEDIKSVVLLTGFSFRNDENVPLGIKRVRWFEIYKLLAHASTEAQDPLDKYLVQQLMSILRDKNLAIEKVG